MKSRKSQSLLILGGALLASAVIPGFGMEMEYHAGASFSLGYIVQSSDTSVFDYNGNRLQSVGAQFMTRAKVSERLSIRAGMGIVERHFPAGDIGSNGGRTPFVWTPYLVNADFQYNWWEDESSSLSLMGGYFPYTYNPQVRNLGLYLLRGPVYPGIVISGFETKHARPLANTLGFRLNHRAGSFEQNFILNSETETFPLFDISPAYVASIGLGGAFRIGAGVSFQHLIPVDKQLTYPDSLAIDGSDAGINGDPNSRTYIYVDTVVNDTTFISFAGTKVMANFMFDPKAFLSGDLLGPEDLKIYGEVAVFGFNTDAAHNALYGTLKQRMPVMVGFNIPAFKLLDHLALEVEWYGARFKDDLSKYQASTGNFYSPIPVVNNANHNLARDDWKWSVHAERNLGNVRLSAQVANDHSRPGGTLTSPSSEWETYFITPRDWYWMAKVAFSL